MTEKETRFWTKVAIGDGCWEWTAAMHPGGHGWFRLDNRGPRRASAIAFELHNGRKAKRQVNHRCGNAKCVRPSHLYDGTQADNMRDVAMGRCHGNRKLTRSDVREIRASTESSRRLAARFGVSQKTVMNILHWRVYRYD